MRMAVTIVLLFISGVVVAQNTPEASSTTEAVPPKIFLGTLSSGVFANKSLSGDCFPSGIVESSVPVAGSNVVVARKYPSCPDGATWYLVYIDGQQFYVESKFVRMSPEDSSQFRSLKLGSDSPSEDEFVAASRTATLRQIQKTRSQFETVSKFGLVLLDARVFDVSEVTEGTGFEFQVVNTGAKPIKYVTATVIGYNAVRDPVRDRVGKSASMTIQGVGPISPSEVAKYKKDYMWLTDLVKTFEVIKIQVEYMDGTTKIHADTSKISVDIDERVFTSAMLKAGKM